MEKDGPPIRARTGGAIRCIFLSLAASMLFFWGLLYPGRPLDGISYSTIVRDRNGAILRVTLSADEKYRIWAALDDYPPRFIEALLMKEDGTFYSHPGVEPLALLRAVWHGAILRDFKSGGSTVTMQLARLLYSLDTDSVGGKLVQIREALRLELVYSKRRILEAYCARVPCGRNIEGFAAAALIYMNKSLAELSLPDMLLLCSLPQKPNERDPTVSSSVIVARDRLFRTWTARHPEDGSSAVRLTMPEAYSGSLPFEAPHTVDSLLARSGGGTRIESTIDLPLQKRLEAILAGYCARHERTGIHNACALLVRAKGMEVLAEVGSADFFDPSIDGQVNGTEAKRSPGSALKPFLYGLAMDQSLVHPMTMLKDAPVHFSGYNPDNYDDEFQGPIKARDALILSRNVPAVSLSRKVKNPDLYDFLKASGVTGLRPKSDYGLSLVLGTGEVTMKELVALYGVLANSGDFSPLRERLDRAPPSVTREMLSPQAAFLVVDILRQKPRPEEIAPGTLKRPPGECAWKTGTSIGFRDAWAVGIFDSFIVAVWVGNFDGSGNPELIGLRIAGPLMFEIVDAVRASGLGLPYAGDGGAREPSGIIRVKVCAISGKIPNRFCPVTVDTYFIPGKSPIDVCDVHQRFNIDVRTGLRRLAPIEGETVSKVFEIWPSDLLDLFDKAGLPRKLPPPLAPEDALLSQESPEKAPEIVSPLPKGEYAVSLGEAADPEIPFIAIVPSDTAEVFWFLNESFLGKSRLGKAYYWTPSPGEFVLRAIDDHGRSASCRFSVAIRE
jgi:penicillin-binding protein 1C